MTAIPSDVTDSTAERSLPDLPERENDWWGAIEGPYFYIDVDVSSGWPRRERTPICKLGVTDKNPEDRREGNERALRGKWDIEATLEVVFVATGQITTAEKAIADHTLPWLLDPFQKSAEWRRCPPRELARIATLIAEDRHHSNAFQSARSDEEVDTRRFLKANERMNGKNITEQARCRRLNVLGTTVHLEPVPAGEGRPLREPRPRNAPYNGPPSQDSSSGRGAFSDRGTPQAELFSGPGRDQSSPGPLMAGEVPSGTGLAHRWLRQRGLFAELRALERSETGREDPAGGDTVGRGECLSVRLSRLETTLLGEAVACSRYRNRSTYLQATVTGRDRRAPVLAKAGVLFFWTRAHFGEDIETDEQGQLGRLTGFLFGTEEVGEALALIRRHLRAARLAASGELEDGKLEDGKLEGGELGGEEDLPPAPERVRRRMDSDLSPLVSTRICRERKRLVRENAAYSAYANMSEYVRHVALGWDRSAEVIAQCATIAEWMESCREADPREEGHWEKGGLGGQVGPREWTRLDDAMCRRFGVFLSGPGGPGRADVEGALRQGTRHLLGAAPETFARRVPAEL